MATKKSHILVLIVLVFSLVACSSNIDEADSSSSQTAKRILLTNGKMGDYTSTYGDDFSFAAIDIKMIDLKEYGIDTNSNGLFDVIEYEWSLSVPEDNEYVFLLDLYQSRDNGNVATSVITQNLTEGIHTLKLNISSKDIFREKTSQRYFISSRVYVNNIEMYRKTAFFATNYFIEKFESSLPASTNQQEQFEECKRLLMAKMKEEPVSELEDAKEIEQYIEQMCFEYSESGMMDEILKEFE